MITDTKIWVTIAGLAAVTYLIRLSFVGLLAGRRLPPAVTRALGFVPVTVLPALIAPMVLSGEDGGIALDPAIILPAAGALILGMATRNVLAGIVGGLGGYGLALLVL